ncbi:MAG: FHA domain-containing protein [Planctomycetes bacterium]|nr:FHA domain-containing protein [Planctomycetota bacterium]
MTATLRWNRLTISVTGDADFKSAIDKSVPDLFKQPFPQLEIDIGQCKNLGDDSFKLIGLKLVDNAGSRKVLVRVPDALRRHFEGSGLADLLDVHVVERMDAHTRIRGEEGEAESGDLQPVADDAEPEEKDETHPPSGDVNVTKIQTRASNGALLDDEDGKRFDVGDELVIGREAPANAVYQIPTISKKHFRIYPQGPAYFIEDLRSTNGTYLNGDPLTQPQPLGEGDEIVVAITLKHPEGARRFKFTTKL